MLDLTRRRFGLLDSLVLIAATAFGLAPLSVTASQLTLARFALPTRTAADAWGPINSLTPYVLWATVHATPLLTNWSLATLALTLRPPGRPCDAWPVAPASRSAWPRWWRRPSPG